MTVREADPEKDAAACAAIYEPYVTESSISFELEPPSPDEMAARIRKAHIWLVAEGDDGRVLGYAYGGTHRERAAYNRTVEVSAYVDQSVHRSGIGRELYTELFARLKQAGYRLLVAGITLPNDASVGIHEALGFYPVGIFKNIGFKNGRWWDVGWWQLDVGEPAGQPSSDPTARSQLP